MGFDIPLVVVPPGDGASGAYSPQAYVQRVKQAAPVQPRIQSSLSGGVLYGESSRATVCVPLIGSGLNVVYRNTESGVSVRITFDEHTDLPHLEITPQDPDLVARVEQVLDAPRTARRLMREVGKVRGLRRSGVSLDSIEDAGGGVMGFLDLVLHPITR